MVDYTSDGPPYATKAEEKALGVRPLWRRYSAESVLAVHSVQIEGKEQFVHVRLAENFTKREGFKEVKRDRVRVLDREDLGNDMYGLPTYQVWEKQEGSTDSQKEEWVSMEGPTPLTIPEIPLVPFFTGRRKGTSWMMHPPMKDAADLQIELYEQESGLKYIKILSAFPMLAGNGVAPATDAEGKPQPINVSPHTVLYAPPSVSGPSGSWKFIEPSAANLKFLSGDVKDTILQLRELGRQPLTAQSGNLTVITSKVVADKGNSAIQAWALNLKAALEQALKSTAMWLKDDSKPVVAIDTEFDLSWGDDDTFGHVSDMRKEGEISREALVHEAKRRKILDADYDPEGDFEKILAEIESDGSDDSDGDGDGDDTGDGTGDDNNDDDDKIT